MPAIGAALRHHRHRRRRHRHRHHRRHPRHGGASRRQGRRHHRHGRARAEGRRGLQPHPHRQQAGGHPRHPRRRAAAPISCSAATSSWPATRRCSRAVEARRDHDGRQHRRILARRFHPQCRFLAADRAAEARDHDRGRRASSSHFVDATRLATALLGNSIGANMFMLGYAYQIGALPLSAESIEKAIELNGEAVRDESWRRSAGAAAPRSIRPRSRRWSSRRRSGERRAQAFAIASTRWSRGASRSSPPTRTRAYARALPARWSSRCRRPKPQRRRARRGLAEAVARYLFKLMAYKDEYEVARLYTDGAFRRAGEVELRRRQSALRIPSRAAAARATRPGDRRAEEDDLRAVDDAGVRRAGEVQVPARHGARSVRLYAPSAAPSAS